MIRKAEKKDAPQVYALLQEIVRLHHDGRPDIFSGLCPKYDIPALCEKMQSPQESIYVSVDGSDRVNGYVLCQYTEQNDPFFTQRPFRTLYVDDLCVAKNARGQGIGRALMETAKADAAARGCYHLELNVWACNPEALRFYTHIGMQPERHYMEWILQDASQP